MIIKEFFSCSAVFIGNECEIIENNGVFSINDKHCNMQENGIVKHHIQFTSSYGSLNDFIHDIYIHRQQILPIIRKDVYVAYEYKDQCNLSFDPDLLRCLSEMNMHLLVSCYTLDEDNQLYTEFVKKGTDSFYYVSNNDILVHNACKLPFKGKPGSMVETPDGAKVRTFRCVRI